MPPYRMFRIQLQWHIIKHAGSMDKQKQAHSWKVNASHLHWDSTSDNVLILYEGKMKSKNNKVWLKRWQTGKLWELIKCEDTSGGCCDQ